MKLTCSGGFLIGPIVLGDKVTSMNTEFKMIPFETTLFMAQFFHSSCYVMVEVTGEFIKLNMMPLDSIIVLQHSCVINIIR